MNVGRTYALLISVLVSWKCHIIYQKINSQNYSEYHFITLQPIGFQLASCYRMFEIATFLRNRCFILEAEM